MFVAAGSHSKMVCCRSESYPLWSDKSWTVLLASIMCIRSSVESKKGVLNAYVILAVNPSESGHSGDRVKEVERWYEHGSVVDLQEGSA